MTTLASDPLPPHQHPHHNHHFDSLDLDAYINFDQPDQKRLQENPDLDSKDDSKQSHHHQSTATPPKDGSRPLSPPTSPTTRSRPSSPHRHHADDTTKPQFLAMPSHEYEQFKQQTGLPPGAIANTFAMNSMQSQPSMSALPFTPTATGFPGIGFPAAAAVPGMNPFAMPAAVPGLPVTGMPPYFVSGATAPGQSAVGMGINPPTANVTQGGQMGMNVNMNMNMPMNMNVGGGIGLPLTPGGGFNPYAQQAPSAPQDAWSGLDFGNEDELDMDLDLDLDETTKSGQTQQSHAGGQFVNPTAINMAPSPDSHNNNNSSSNTSPPNSSATTTQVGRMYPGMHSQQAAMAKAAQQKRLAEQQLAQHQDFLRRQTAIQNAMRVQQQQAQQVQVQQQQAAQLQQQQQQSQQSQGQLQVQHLQQQQQRPQTQQQPEDMHAIDSRISDLLARMRANQGSATEFMPASKHLPLPSTPSGSGSASPPTSASAAAAAAAAAAATLHITRTRKEEEEMDEDERLLASEEGKKLSSKERRQLRNKVSARAFRSRRKEYIGHLEGEVAAKGAEVSELQLANRVLVEENGRLMELARWLLGGGAGAGAAGVGIGAAETAGQVNGAGGAGAGAGAGTPRRANGRAGARKESARGSVATSSSAGGNARESSSSQGQGQGQGQGYDFSAPPEPTPTGHAHAQRMMMATGGHPSQGRGAPTGAAEELVV